MRTTRGEILTQGLLAGLLGYFVIALSVSAIDALQGRSIFYTVSLLGEWLFQDLKDPADVRIWPGAVFAYNGLHLVTLLAFGMCAAWLASFGERAALYWYSSLVVYLFIFLHLLAAVLFMTEPLRNEIPLYQVLIPGLLAGVAVGALVLRMHPQLEHEMQEWVDADDGDEAPPVIEARPR